MELKVKDMDISTGGPLVTILNYEDAKLLDLHLGDRLRLFHGGRSIVTVVDIAESDHAVTKGFIGLFEEVLEGLDVRDYEKVRVELEDKPASVSYIREKLCGKVLSASKLQSIVKDIINNELTDIELTYFVSGCFTRGLTMTETVALTKAMIRLGHKLRLKRPVFDKHCVGGVAGNRTTMIIVPIVAAAGLQIPKTSSRSITSPAGTADTMEVLCKVTLSAEQMTKVVREANGCIVWGGKMNLAAADDKMIRTRHPLALDPEGMLLASVMAKKGAVSSSHVLIDIPYGRGAKLPTRKAALHLKEQFEKLGSLLGMQMKVITTDGSEPIGNGIGPVLEAIDVMKVLANKHDAPRDLVDKSLMMAGHILELSGKAPNGSGKKMASEILASGRALDKMLQIIKLQGQNLEYHTLQPAEHRLDITSATSGKVKHIDNKHISKIARVAGAPEDIYAGIYLHKKRGDVVRKGDVLFTIYAASRTKLRFANKMFDLVDGYQIG